jgi:hypothetical protein
MRIAEVEEKFRRKNVLKTWQKVEQFPENII